MLSKPIADITPFTLLDYPHHSACILWYAGCNMRCLYCYNPEIVLGKGTIDFSSVITFLNHRKGLLDAVVFSGGECLMHKAICHHINEIKKLGFLVKIDTNGSKPQLLEQLIKEQQIDYVALDFKAPQEKFKTITQSNRYAAFEQSLTLLLQSDIPFEVRTTVHSQLLSEKDLQYMTTFLEARGYQGNYHIQSFRNNVDTLGQLGFSPQMQEKQVASTTSKIKIVYR
ncbi:anaerobic ribonucleoside-triphosphate reductase activating protein [Flavobacterium sp. XGLA_31]|uniref:anaerobic ribonucleoside-triphosphate reductase activating protein n=1 Tax=Flavobacterium sp. XGLA_31 TaxID=3447666 RepID=UPI003F3326FD